MNAECYRSVSLTNFEELREVKSWIAVGDEEYTYLQTLLKMLPLGIPALLRRTPLLNIDFFLGERV